MLPSPDGIVAGKTSCEAFDSLIDLIHKALQTKEQSHTTISAAWRLIVDRKLWSSRYQSLEQVQDIYDFENIIQPSIEAHLRYERRRDSLRSKICGRWPTFNNTSFSRDIQEESLLRTLERLSLMVGEEEGLQLLLDAVKARYYGTLEK